MASVFISNVIKRLPGNIGLWRKIHLHQVLEWLSHLVEDTGKGMQRIEPRKQQEQDTKDKKIVIEEFRFPDIYQET